MQRLLVVLVGVAAPLWILAGSAGAQTGGAGKPPDAEAHKAWMNDAADAQEDLREALAAKDGKAVSVAAGKIEGFMVRTETYWAAKNAADIVKLAQTSRSLSKEVGVAADANKVDAAQAAFVKLSATCNACHDLHPEKR